jgi:type VI secretion system protein VasD
MGRGSRIVVLAGLLSFAVLTGSTLSGCASVDKLTLTTSPRLNTCEGTDPHPVVLRVYYLRGVAKFRAADFSALWDDDRTVLADDRLEMHEKTLNPRQQVTLSIERSDEVKEATALGIIANFCRPGEGCWRQVVPIEGRKTAIRVHLDEGCLSID